MATKTTTPASKPASPKTVAAKASTKAAKPVAETAAAVKPAAKTASKRTTTAKKKVAMTPEQRYKMVAEAAYYIAERQGFGGDPVQCWLEAEAQIAAQLK